MSKHVGSVDEVVLYKLVSNAESTGKDVHYSLKVCNDFSWSLFVFGRQIVPATSPVLAQLPRLIPSAVDVKLLIEVLDSSKVCPGNNDPKFDELVKCRHNGKFMNVSGKLDSN